MSFARIFSLLAALVLLAAPAYAADINAEGAAKLKTIFTNILANQKSMTKPGGATLDYDGEVMVEQAATYYAVTLPHIRMTYPNGARLDIGMVSVNASPADAPGQWKMAVAIPTPIILMDEHQTQAIKVSIGAQKAAGIWDESLENFAKLDAQYKNITVENPTSGFALQIPEAQVLYDFSSSGDGRWSGPGMVSVKNITAAMPGHASVKVGEIRGDFEISKYNPAAVKAYREFAKPYFDSLKPGVAPDPAKSTELANKLTELFLNSTDSMKGEYTISGLEIIRPNPMTGGQDQLKLAKGSFGVALSGFMADKASFGMHMSYNGFGITPVPPGYEGVLPAESNIDIALTNIPIQQLVGVAKNTMEGAIKQPDMAGIAGFSLLMKMPAILSQAGTVMDIKNNFIGNDDYRFELNGQAKADINAVNNITANLKGTFRGLDKLITRVNAVAADSARPAAAQNAQGLAGSLAVLKAYGKPDGGAEPVYSYDFVIDPQGQMLINGKPLGIGGGAPAAKPTLVPTEKPSIQPQVKTPSAPSP